MPQYASFAERLLAGAAAGRASAAAHKELMMRLGLPLLIERQEKAKDRAQALLLDDKRTAREAEQHKQTLQVQLDIAKENTDTKLTIAELTKSINQIKEGKPGDFTINDPTGDKHFTHQWNPLTNKWDRVLEYTGAPDKSTPPKYTWAKDATGKVYYATPEEIRSQGLEPIKISSEYESPFSEPESAPASESGMGWNDVNDPFKMFH